jgi:hypothetical protein
VRGGRSASRKGSSGRDRSCGFASAPQGLAPHLAPWAGANKPGPRRSTRAGE